MRNNTYVLDSSFLLALLNPHDLSHIQAREQLFACDGESVHFEIPLVCVVEALIKNPKPLEYVNLLKELIAGRDFILTNTLDIGFISAMPIKNRSVLRANDCTVIAIASRLKAQILTLDKKMASFCQPEAI